MDHSIGHQMTIRAVRTSPEAFERFAPNFSTDYPFVGRALRERFGAGA